jgi:hypothetical protein
MIEHVTQSKLEMINLTIKQMGGVLNVEQNGGLVFIIKVRDHLKL